MKSWANEGLLSNHVELSQVCVCVCGCGLCVSVWIELWMCVSMDGGCV